MQPYEEDGQGVHEAVHGAGTHRRFEHRPVGQRTAQVAGDEDGFEGRAVGVAASGDHGQGVDRGYRETVEGAQEFVLAQRGPFGEFLHAHDLAARARIADDVPRDAPGKWHQVFVRPLLQGDVPGEFEEEGRVFGVGGADLQSHAVTVPGSRVGSTDGPVGTRRRRRDSGSSRPIHGDRTPKGRCGSSPGPDPHHGFTGEPPHGGQSLRCSRIRCIPLFQFSLSAATAASRSPRWRHSAIRSCSTAERSRMSWSPRATRS